FTASSRQRCRRFKSASSSASSFFNGSRATPGTSPATTHRFRLNSTTATRVLSWSKATRDLLRSFLRMGHLSVGLRATRVPHTLVARPIESLPLGEGRRQKRVYALRRRGEGAMISAAAPSPLRPVMQRHSAYEVIPAEQERGPEQVAGDRIAQERQR